jgi:hypothetical protein
MTRILYIKILLLAYLKKNLSIMENQACNKGLCSCMMKDKADKSFEHN